MAKFTRINTLGDETDNEILTGSDREQAEALASGRQRICPRCGSAMAAVGRCLSCGALVDSGGQVTGIQPITDAELKVRIVKQQQLMSSGWKRFVIGFGVMLVGIVAAVFGFLQGVIVLGVAGVVAGLAGVGLVAMGAVSNSAGLGVTQESIACGVVLPALESIFEDVWYRKKGHISSEDIHRPDMIPIPWNDLYGSDHIRCTYRGRPLEMSDVTISHVRLVKDADGKKKRYPERVLSGLWLISSYDEPPAADVRIIERQGASHLNEKLRGQLLGMQSDAETANPAFNDRFIIQAEHPQDALRLLTPELMECLLAEPGDTYLCFAGDGRLHIAIDTQHDSFEFDWSTVADDLDDIRRRILADIRRATNVIDGVVGG